MKGQEILLPATPITTPFVDVIKRRIVMTAKHARMELLTSLWEPVKKINDRQKIGGKKGLNITSKTVK